MHPLFFVVFWYFNFYFYVSLCLFVFRVSLLALGPRVAFYAWVTRDVTSDSVPFWVPPPRTARALSATWIVVSTPARIASSDRHSVALALSSSL